MNRDEIIAFLKEELRLEVDFTPWYYGRSNELEVKISIGDVKIASATCTVEPTEDSYW